MSDQSNSEFDQLRQKPIFMEVMRQGPRDVAKVEAVLCAVLEAVLEACEQDGLTIGPDLLASRGACSRSHCCANRLVLGSNGSSRPAAGDEAVVALRGGGNLDAPEKATEFREKSRRPVLVRVRVCGNW